MDDPCLIQCALGDEVDEMEVGADAPVRVAAAAVLGRQGLGRAGKVRL